MWIHHKIVVTGSNPELKNDCDCDGFIMCGQRKTDNWLWRTDTTIPPQKKDGWMRKKDATTKCKTRLPFLLVSRKE
jgi:hypothetical protein